MPLTGWLVIRFVVLFFAFVRRPAPGASEDQDRHSTTPIRPQLFRRSITSVSAAVRRPSQIIVDRAISRRRTGSCLLRRCGLRSFFAWLDRAWLLAMKAPFIPWDSNLQRLRRAGTSSTLPSSLCRQVGKVVASLRRAWLQEIRPAASSSTLFILLQSERRSAARASIFLMSSFMAYCTAQAAPLEKSTTMPSHKLQPSAAGAGAAAGYVHMISSHSCSGILQEPSSRRSSQYSSYDLHPASVYVATTPCSLSNSLPCSDDLSGDKTMVVQGEELSPPPALLSKTTTTTCGGNRSWSSSSLDYPAAVAASFPSSVSLQNYCDDSSNNGGGQDWTQFSNSHATFFSNGGPTSTHHFSSQARCCWQPGFAGLNNIDDNLPPPPTGTNSSSTLNAAASASRQRLLSTIHDPSFASRFSYVNNNNSGYTCSHEQQRSHSLSAASEYTFFDGQDGFNAERESAIQGKSTAEEEADHHLDCRQPGLLQAEFMERETEDISATVAFEYDEEGAAAAAGQGRNSSSFRLSQNAAWESAFFVPRDGGAGARNPGGGMGKRKTTPPGPPQEEQQNNDHVYGTIRLEPCCFGGRDDAEV